MQIHWAVFPEQALPRTGLHRLLRVRAWKSAVLLMAVLALACVSAGAEGIPKALRFSQTTVTRELGQNRVLHTTLPVTARSDVDVAVKKLVNRIVREGKASLPVRGDAATQAVLDVGPYIWRTGRSTMSFLIVGCISNAGDQTWVRMEARVYDMKNGTRLQLNDIVKDEKGAWAFLAKQIRKQLKAYWPQEKPDAEALSALVTREGILATPFTLTPGHLALHYTARSLYPGQAPVLMHVNIPYSALNPYMTDRGITRTDAEGYQLTALTFDDGPGRVSTGKLLNTLRRYGADATFFLVGERIANNLDVTRRTHDAGFPQGSHSWVHEYEGITSAKVSVWQKQFNAALTRATGLVPRLMRAPGGAQNSYLRAGWNLPMIHWSLISGDAARWDDPAREAQACARKIGWAHDGDIVLCHDLNARAWSYVETALKNLEDKGFLCVSVEDLYEVRGKTLEKGTVYYGLSDRVLDRP